MNRLLTERAIADLRRPLNEDTPPRPWRPYLPSAGWVVLDSSGKDILHARRDDADLLVRLVNEAVNGLPDLLDQIERLRQRADVDRESIRYAAEVMQGACAAAETYGPEAGMRVIAMHLLAIGLVPATEDGGS